jgi:hypothetical protein
MRSVYLLFAVSLALAPLPVLAATPGALQAEQSPTMPSPAGLKGKGGGKLAAFLTPEQLAMFALGNRDQLKDMTPDQRKGWRKDQMAKVLGMSPADRQKFKADLQARWDGLPARQKARLSQRLASRDGASATAQ